MATLTDLQGALKLEDDNLSSRFHKWFSAGPDAPTGEVYINIRWTPIGGSTPEKLNEDPIAVRPDIRGIDNLIDKISSIIVEKQGTSPIGTLRITGYEKGKSTSPKLDFNRTLRPPDMNGLSDPNLTLLRSVWEADRRLLTTLVAELRASQQSLTILVADQAKTIASLATTRTAGTTGNDLSNLFAVAALVLLILLLPYIRSAFGLSPSAGVAEVAKAARDALSSAVSARPEGQESQGPPASVLEPRQLAEVEKPAFDLEGFIGALKTNPGMGLAFIEKMATDPDTLSKAVAAVNAAKEMAGNVANNGA